MEFLTQLLPDGEHMAHFHFLFQIALILLSIKGAGHLATRLGQPSVLGKLLVGLVLGPALLGWVEMTPFLKQLSEVGVIMLMFLAGLETDFEQFKRSAGGATIVAVSGVAVPFIGGWLTAGFFGYSGISAIFVGVLLVATSVSISVQTLRELGYLQSPEGVTILAAAVIDDVLGVIVLSAVLGMAAGGGTAGLVGLAIKIPVYFILAAFVGLKLVPPFLRWLSGFQVGAPLAAGAIAIALGFAYAAEAFGIAGIVGAYVAGLILSTTDLKDRTTHEVEAPAFSFFVPFFFASVGLTTEVSGLSGSFYMMAILLTAVGVVTKLIGCGGGALLAKFNKRSAIGIGCGMVARGEVGLIMATIGRDRGLIGGELFTAMVLVSLLTTLVTPPMLKMAFPGKKENQAA